MTKSVKKKLVPILCVRDVLIWREDEYCSGRISVVVIRQKM